MSNRCYSLFVLFTILITFACNRPVAKFLVKSQEVKALQEVKFENNSKKAEFYEWNFIDGDQSVEESPTYIFYKPGEYEIVLKAINTKKSDTYKRKIKVLKPEKTLVEIETPLGNMIAELYDDTPSHKENFVKLAKEGFYDNLLFHRVISGFMIQGGDPISRDTTARNIGTGGPGYTIDHEMESGHIHLKGALAAARQPDAVNPEKKSSGSQFYIVHGKELSEQEINMAEKRLNLEYSDEQKMEYLEHGGYPFLDGNYTVFGRVLKGLDVLDAIAESRTGMADRPVENIQMKIKVID